MTIDIEKYNKRLDKRISEFSGRFMSNAKWTKVFTALSQNSDIIKKCLVKDVLDDTLRQIDIPTFQKFTDTFHDQGIKDVMTGGPSTFRQIEWIEFPAHWTIDRTMRTETLEPHEFHQDIATIQNLLNKVGEFAINFDNDKLIVFGYR